jgi:MoxR-like ATPase
MLPADIIGINIFDKNSSQFQFQQGPVFSQLVLADEINRTSAKTQSALLEAMEENQVSVDGITYPLTKPFFVIATQNPQTQAGTFSLPESQLDRFLMRIHLGYPDHETERKILSGDDKRERLKALQPVFSIDQLLQMQQQVKKIHLSDPILDYIQSILKFSRQNSIFSLGLSPRAGLALVKASKSWAFMHQRKMVIPDDVNAVLGSIILHRITCHDHEMSLEPTDSLQPGDSHQQILAEFEKLSVF